MAEPHSPGMVRRTLEPLPNSSAPRIVAQSAGFVILAGAVRLVPAICLSSGSRHLSMSDLS